MRAILFCLALCCAGAATADSLADANKLLEAKSYPAAVQMLGKLADGGNADAQLRLGELYWYGEGVGVDRAKADNLFAKASASGNKIAAAATQLSGKREQRKNDIAYWSVNYDGADLRSGKFNCVAPVFPAVSTTRDDIKETSAKAETWLQCYKGVVDNVASAMPPGKRIPDDILILMSDQEVEQAKVHLDKVYAGVLASAKADALATIAQRDAWTKATSEYVAAANRATEEHTREVKQRIETAIHNARANPDSGHPVMPTANR